MKTYIWVSAILLLAGSAINAQISFIVQPQNITTEPGTDIILPCTLSSPAPSPAGCLWSFQKYYAGQISTFSPDGNNGYSLVNSQPTSDCSLKIINAQLEHDGFYRCGYLPTVINPGGQKVSDPPAKVSILDLPEEPYIEFRGSSIPDRSALKVNENEFNTVKCIVKNGNPEPQIRWYIDSTELSDVNTIAVNSSTQYLLDTISELNITARFDMQHKFLSCNATHDSYEIYNNTNNVLSRSVVLVMQGPVTKVYAGFGNGSLQYIELYPGDQVSLNCTTYAEPDPEFVWERKNDANSNNWYELFKGAVREAYPAETGYYRCGARNDLNSNSYVYNEPALQIKVTYTEDEGLTPGAIAGITIGCFFFVALLIGVIFYLYRKGKFCFRHRPTTTTGMRQTPQVVSHGAKHQESQPLRDIHNPPTHQAPRPIVREYKDNAHEKSAHHDSSASISNSASHSAH